MSDEELMALFAGQGNEGALRNLINRYTSPMYRTACFLLRNAKEAEDAVQECFFRITQKRQSYKTGTRFAPWAFTILRNICIDELRKRQGRLLSPLIPERHESPDSASRDLEDEEMQKTVAAALQELPETDRLAVTLRIYGELDFKGVAEACGISTEAAKKRFYRALDALKESLSRFVENTV